MSISTQHGSQHSPRGLKDCYQGSDSEWEREKVRSDLLCREVVSNGRHVMCMCPRGEGRNTDKVPLAAGVEWMFS